jgi:phospholipase C
VPAASGFSPLSLQCDQRRQPAPGDAPSNCDSISAAFAAWLRRKSRPRRSRPAGTTQKIVDDVQANRALWASTAIIVTFDGGGGYYDSGYIQPLDYFGDGTRIPTLVVSPFTTAGHISHTYTDHVSILKFIEANWHLAPVTDRSRDNLPNPISTKSNPYVPLNTPAIGNLMDLFTF